MENLEKTRSQIGQLRKLNLVLPECQFRALLRSTSQIVKMKNLYFGNTENYLWQKKYFPKWNKWSNLMLYTVFRL